MSPFLLYSLYRVWRYCSKNRFNPIYRDTTNHLKDFLSIVHPLRYDHISSVPAEQPEVDLPDSLRLDEFGYVDKATSQSGRPRASSSSGWLSI